MPIDLDEDPFDRSLELMHELFRNQIRDYFCATEIYAGEAYRSGFPYLNSREGDKIHRDKNEMEKIFVSGSNNFRLLQMHSDWLKWNDKRENNWIDKITDRFQWDKVHTAIFLVGAAHRVRLIEKISNRLVNDKASPQWEFYTFDSQ